MILRLQVPFLETFARGGTVASWHASEGDLLRFGDPICDIALSEWMALRKTKRAINLVRIHGKGQEKVRHDFELRQGRGVLTMRIVASEDGYLRQVLAATGRRGNVDDLLAFVSTEPQEPLATDTSAAPAMRVVATSAEAREGTS